MFRRGLGIATLLILCYFPLFFHLDSLPIQLYDESRLAVNALEMSADGDFLVTHFNGEPDMWNTKPPLMIWLQVLCLKTIGNGELAIRLPSALAALATILLLGVFCWKKLNRPILGCCAMGVLMTTPGYINTHVARTGDYDALLILFMTLFLFTFFNFIHSEEKKEKTKLFYWAALWLVFAVLTKSIAGLLFLPAAFFYLLWKGQLLTVLKSKHTYLAVAFFVILVGSYYGLREHFNPGYLKAVWENELGGRYFETLENHNKPFNYYFKNISDWRFLPWLYFLPVGLAIGFYEKGKVRHFTHLLFVGAISYLLVVSSAGTKLQWYDAPAFPLMAIITALGIEKVSALLAKKLKVNQFIFIAILFAVPYFNTVKSAYSNPSSTPQSHYYGLFMRDFPEYKKYAIVSMGYNSHVTFYQKMYNQNGYEIDHTWTSNIQVGDTAMFCEEKPIGVLNELYEYKILEESWGCFLVKITHRKN